MEKLWYKSYAKGVPYNLKYEPTPMVQALARTTEQFPDKTSLIFLDSRLSYRQLNDMVNRMANAFIDLGVKPGDKVAMLLPNMPQIVVATFAAWRAGAVVVMNNPLYTDKELNIPPTPNVYEWMDLLKKSPSTAPKISVNFESLACLQYTGGTTGVSKGVMLTHANLSKNVQQIIAWFPGFNKGEITHLGVLPIFHSFGLTACMNICIWMGWADVLIPRPEPQVSLEAI